MRFGFLFFALLMFPTAQGAEFERFERNAPYPGNPGAEIRTIRYSDGMGVKVAFYGEGRSGLPPVGVIAGYAMDVSYLHSLASNLSRKGFPVFLVQPPGNGVGAMCSGFVGGRDGYHNTIEGFAASYMDGLGEALSRHYGERVLLLGHSRAGYQVRFFLTGLRHTGRSHEGRPELAYRPDALAQAQERFLALASLYSPLSPDERLVRSAAGNREAMERIRAFEDLMYREKETFVDGAGDAAAVAVGLSPANLLWGPFAPIAALVNAGITRQVTRGFASAQAAAIERLGKRRVAELLSGRRSLDGADRGFLDLMRRRYGRALVPSFEQLREDIENAQWMAEGADAEALMHLMEFASKEGPTPEAEREMNGFIAQRGGLSGWKTAGVDPEGKAYSVVRALGRAQRDRALPYYVFSASGDGDAQAAQREARLACAAEACVIQGGHGGAVLSAGAIEELGGELRRICVNALRAR